jgi:hypothetical protein
MKRSILIKGLTLTCFFGLVLGFLFYKSGKLDGYIYNDIQTSHNGGAIAAEKDTGKSKPKPRMSGSKSMVITDEVRMSSSKSGGVFTPRPSASDSTKRADSIKATLKK